MMKIAYSLRCIAIILTTSSYILLSGCAPTTQRARVSAGTVANEAHLQRMYALERAVQYRERVDRVSYPILTSAVKDCGDNLKSYHGVLIANRYAWKEEYQSAASEKFGLSDRPQVFFVTPDSPADDAGLMKGDVMVSINGSPSPTGNNSIQRITKQFDQNTKSGTIVLEVLRNGEKLTKTMILEPICNYPVNISDSDEVNAYADGLQIVITKGMLRFAETDQELALVISHELAHNTMGHMGKKTGNYLLGSILDIAAAAYGVNTQGAFGNATAGAFSQDFEAEADYVGLYYMAWAGYPLSGSTDFWRRMAAEHPGNIKNNFSSTHPATSERFVELEHAVAEIDQKRASQIPLVPNKK